MIALSVDGRIMQEKCKEGAKRAQIAKNAQARAQANKYQQLRRRGKSGSAENSQRVLRMIINSLFLEAPNSLSTVQIANSCKLHPGLVGAVLARAQWAARRQRVRINRDRRETRWMATDEAMIDYATRHMGRPSRLRQKGISITRGDDGRITLRCGSMMAVFHLG